MVVAAKCRGCESCRRQILCLFFFYIDLGFDHVMLSVNHLHMIYQAYLLTKCGNKI